MCSFSPNYNPSNQHQGTSLHLAMDKTTFRSRNFPVSEGNVAGGPAPPTDTSPPPSETFVKKSVEFSEIENNKIDALVKKFKETHGDLILKSAEGIPPGISYCNNENEFVKIQRGDRKYNAKRFRSQYAYGTTADGCTNPFAGTIEDRTCIWSNDSCSWMEKSSGIIWVGVHGLDSICVVTMSEHLDWKRVRGGLACTDVRTVLSLFKKCVLSEIEDLADPSSELRQRLSWSIDKPFGVVSVCPVTTKIHKESGHEASSVEYDDKRAVNFLREKMTSETSFTVTETIQTAISAFQLLFQKKLEANEIEVSVVDPEYRIHAHETNKDPTVEELEMCKMEKYLAAINKPGSGETEDHAAVIDDPGCRRGCGDAGAPFPSLLGK